ncbi:MAG: fibronectin type III domain-containing protein [Clostridiales bacterium]|nr:fibronectin type III domain-containing protein [Clostridiales bacterium]
MAKIFSVLLAMIMIFQSSATVFASTKLKSAYTGSTYTHQTKFDEYDIEYGIDVSKHNGTINFKKVKADGIDFVFIRVGYTGYTKSSFSLNYDSNYKTYIKDALAAGLKVGVYWYSQALTTTEAVQEATKLLSAISSYDITMPVVMDYEFAGTSAGRLDSASLSKSKMTANVLAFLDTVSSAGYDACLYASKSFLENRMNVSNISSLYTIWLAHYTTSTSYSGDYEYWQYSSKGSVSGISGNTDVNFRYIDDVIDLEDQVYTGSAITPEPSVSFDSNSVLTKDVDYTLKYSSNKKLGYGIVEAVGTGNYDGYSQTYRFKIVPAKVEDLTFVSNGKTSLKYKWSAVAGASSYRLYITNNTAGTTFTKTVTGTSATISNLTQGNKYSVKIAAGGTNSSDETIWGEYSDVDTRVTLGSKVSGVAMKSRTTTSIKITWNEIVDAEKYIIYVYNTSSESYKEKARVSSSKNTYKITGLKAGTTYKFKVAAVKDGVTGTKSNKLKAATKAKKVTVKSAKSSAKKRITVKWKTTACTGYEIQWSTTKKFTSNRKTVTVSGKSKSSKTIKTAQSSRKYYVRVRAYTKVNGVKVYGAWSKTQTVKVK